MVFLGELEFAVWHATQEAIIKKERHEESAAFLSDDVSSQIVVYIAENAAAFVSSKVEVGELRLRSAFAKRYRA